MKEKQYKIGDIQFGWHIVDYQNCYYVVKCIVCGNISKRKPCTFSQSCKCFSKSKRIVQKIKFEHPEVHRAKIEAIKEKYKNGVTIEHINTMLGIEK